MLLTDLDLKSAHSSCQIQLTVQFSLRLCSEGQPGTSCLGGFRLCHSLQSCALHTTCFYCLHCHCCYYYYFLVLKRSVAVITMISFIFQYLTDDSVLSGHCTTCVTCQMVVLQALLVTIVKW